MSTKTAIITGCSSGIGFEVAKLFSSKGWNVVATMRNPESDAGKELAQLPQTLVTKLDVQDLASIHSAVDAAVTRFKRIDLLVNNAGYGQYGIIEAVSREQVQAQFEVNVFGVIDTIKAVVPHMRSNDPIDGRRGTIINVGSGAGIFTLPILAIYIASKHALAGLTEAISYELSSQQIVTKLVTPYSGVTETKFTSRAAGVFSPQDPTLAEAYSSFFKNVSAGYAKMTASRKLSSKMVAEFILDAATDGKDQVRYYIGDDPLNLFRNKMELSEEDYINFIRSQFL